MLVGFKLLVIRPAKGFDVCQAMLEDDGDGISFLCLKSLCASNLDGYVIYPVLKYSIWPGE